MPLVYTIMIKAEGEVRSLVREKIVDTVRWFKDLGWGGAGKKAVISGSTFLVEHIPVVGPALSKFVGWGVQKVLDKKELSALRQAVESEKDITKRLTIASRILDESDLQSTRKAYNALIDYMNAECAPKLSNCKDVSNAARVMASAEVCVKDLREWLALIRSFEKDLSSELERIEGELKTRKHILRMCLEAFFKTHKACNASQKCYLELQKDPTWLSHGIELVPLNKNPSMH